METSKDNVSWNVEYYATCKSNNLRILLSGDHNGGIVSLIRSFGFFEGGFDGSNNYRIDPDVLNCFLSGSAATIEALNYVKRCKEKKIELINMEKSKLIQEMEPLIRGPNGKEVAEFLRLQMEFFDKKLKE